MLLGNLPELRLERRSHFRGRLRDGRTVGLRFRQLRTAGGDRGNQAGFGGAGGAGSGAEIGVGEWVSSRVRDLGVGGAFVATYRSLPVGTALEVEVDLPGPNGPIAIQAEVRWLAEPGRLPAGCDAGMGLAFAPLEVDALLVLSDYLAGLAAEKGPP